MKKAVECTRVLGFGWNGVFVAALIWLAAPVPAAYALDNSPAPQAVNVPFYGAAGVKTVPYNTPGRDARRGQRGEGRRAEKMPYHRMEEVTPYGDFCTHCSKYGMGKRPVLQAEAVSALNIYFNEKGLAVKNISGKGRFMKVDIYRGHTLVDRILFDRRTGRIRSIY